jgi:hypothetical protein
MVLPIPTDRGSKGLALRRRLPTVRRRLLPLLLASLALPDAVSAQLRPYDPFDWEIFDAGRDYLLAGGGFLLLDQRASLAGTEGKLLEIGSFQALSRFGPVVLDAGGTLYRVLHEDRRFTSPAPDTHDHELGRRRDSGDYRIGTTLLLTPALRPEALALRFGTRLPTTDNRVGLERDQTDFFAMLAGRLDRGLLRATAEVGVGIHGTRESGFEQSDVLVFSTGVSRKDGRIRPGLWLVGHADGLRDRAIRGNEELAELRFQLRAGGSTWLQLQMIRGLTEYSPGLGLGIAVGATW